MRGVMTCGVVAVLVLGAFFVLTNQARAQPAGGFVDTMSWFRQPSATNALLDMESGAMDVWLYYFARPSDVAAAKTNPAIGTIDVGGSWDNLFVNPIAVNQILAPGLVNPFTNRDWQRFKCEF